MTREARNASSRRYYAAHRAERAAYHRRHYAAHRAERALRPMTKPAISAAEARRRAAALFGTVAKEGQA